MRPINASRSRGSLAVAGALSIIAVAPAMAQSPTPARSAQGTTGATGAHGTTGATGARGTTGATGARGTTGATSTTGTHGAAGPGGVHTTTPVRKATSSFRVDSARRNVTLGQRTLVKGTLRPARGGRRVQLQVRRGKRWETVARDVTDARGAWRLRFTPTAPSAMRTRVAFAGDRRGTAVARNVGPVNVFRRALASWYGPGLYGSHLACGGRLSPGTLGVANKHLPCGTKITLRHGTRSVRVAVVDRGPYVGAREFDLTSATRTRLGFSGTGTVLSTR